jgi:rifampicin phosphotransferase
MLPNHSRVADRYQRVADLTDLNRDSRDADHTDLDRDPRDADLTDLNTDPRDADFTDSLIVPLAHACDLREVGGKAHNLARLMRLGQPVPDGFVVTNSALRLFLAEHDLQPLVDALTIKLDTRAPRGIRAAAETIAALIREFPLPPAIAADLDAGHLPYLTDTLIVRSSAIGEDSAEASFAGQLDSIRDVTGAGLLRRAVLDVWASRWSERALTYQLARGIALGGVGVVVQRQVDSAISGVLFTVAPDSPRHMLVEYCGGAGDALVSGRENPGRLTISRRDFRWSAQVAPDRAATAGALLLNDLQLAALGRRALEIERAFGGPQDIEWTMDADGRVWIVQSRPITSAGRFNRQSAINNPQSSIGNTQFNRQSSITNQQCQHWSNANVNENFPQPISPLLYSIARTGYYHYFRNLGLAFGVSSRRIDAMEEPLRHIIGVHGARMYYNLSGIHGLLRSVPFGERLAGSFDQFVGTDATDAPALDPVRAERSVTGLLRQACELAVIATRTVWQYLFLTKRVEEFERTIAAYAERTHPDWLRDRSLQDLLADLRGFRDIRNHRWIGGALADSASMVCYGILQRCLTRAFPAADQAALHNQLLRALPDLVSSKPALMIWSLSRLVRSDRQLLDLIGIKPAAEVVATIRRDARFEAFRREFDRFLDDWGFRCSGELMLTFPSFQEEPERLIEILKTYVSLDSDSPADQLRRQEADRLRDTARVAEALRKRPLIRFVPFLNEWLVVSVVLRWTQRAILLRERARLKQALLYSRLRRIALAIGAQLVAADRLDADDDVFFLTVEELDDLLSGGAMFPNVRGLVGLRRQTHRELSLTCPPDAFTVPVGDYWSEPRGLGSSEARGLGSSDARACRAEARQGEGGVFRGLGVCGGNITARAAVLDDVSEAHKLQPGDVLITRQTDPGWGAVFPLISGLVIERGGMLSHGAIIAREFGIPSVVGINGATRVVPHGRTVHVDGDRGLVRIED